MKIDEIIKNHKEKLDVEKAPDDLWENIRSEWKADSVNKKNSIAVWKVAASIMLFTTFGLLIYTNSLRNEIDELASLGDISIEYQKIERDYQSEIRSLEASIPISQINSSQSYSWLLEELETLEKVNELYRADIGKLSSEEQLIQVLIDYYEKKIKLLKKLDLEISRDKKNEESREKRKELKS